MIEFTKEQIEKYRNHKITGTTILGFRDLDVFAKLIHADLTKVLDFGCGCGRSTRFLQSFCEHVYGCDITESALEIARARLPDNIFFLNKVNANRLSERDFTSVFMLYVVFHFSNKREIYHEFKKIYEALIPGGVLFVVSGTKALYEKEYLTVRSVGKPPTYDGDRASVYLSAINCEVEDVYWSASILENIAHDIGFMTAACHFPVGYPEDNIDYISEVKFAPYYLLGLRKPYC